jgi:hypothetical protein
MSRRLILVVTAVVGLALLGTAAWATLPQVDPATVPLGNLVANNSVSTPLKVKVAGGSEHVLADGTEVFIVHGVLPPGGSSGWHTHLGPVLVTVVSGAITLYDGDDKTCTGVTYPAGHGFIDRGFGHVHLAANEGSVPAVTYSTYILPPNAGDTLRLPAAPNPDCPPSVH